MVLPNVQDPHQFLFCWFLFCWFLFHFLFHCDLFALKLGWSLPLNVQDPHQFLFCWFLFCWFLFHFLFCCDLFALKHGWSLTIFYSAMTFLHLHLNVPTTLYSVFRWFKFTLKPPNSITTGNLLSAIWDTSYWNFFVKFGLKTA